MIYIYTHVHIHVCNMDTVEICTAMKLYAECSKTHMNPPFPSFKPPVKCKLMARFL